MIVARKNGSVNKQAHPPLPERDPLVNSLKLSIQPIEDQNVILLTQTAA